MPPWPAYAQINLYLLSGGDRFANLVQWSAMIVSLVLVSRIASLLGAGRRGQLLAALFAATVPVGVSLASTSFTDYLAATWVVVSVWLVVRSMKTSPGWFEWLGLGLTAALGYLTKGTYVLFALPFFLWFAVNRIRHSRVSEWLLRGSVVMALILVMVSPYWIRNLSAFHSIMGPEAHVDMLSNEKPGLEALVSNLVRYSAIQLAGPSRAANQAVESTSRSLLWTLGIDPDNPSYSYQQGLFGVGWLFPGSDSAPLHTGIMVICSAVVLLARRYRSRDVLLLLGLTFLGYLIFCGTLRWQATTRFTLSVFLLLAPVVGWVLTREGSILRLPLAAVLPPAAAVLMLLYAAPSLLFLRWRPLIGLQPRTALQSITQLSRHDMYFRVERQDQELFELLSEQILQTGCKAVALRADSHDHEYLWWVLLEPLKNGIRIEHTLVYPGLEPLLAEDFEPCAMICTVCSDSPNERNGLWPVDLSTDIKLYLPQEFFTP